ncbi:uncharacterized protein LOC128535750 [Clarias gariepinus]|uniref:uncharacterized protein LOC128535750 n=1 Tax=Clarias gariepinus TaxID=13013 RepID=UPI00234DFC9A|nr:uncharacterized protein LOC128535750 [Clarias gariepinus]
MGTRHSLSSPISYWDPTKAKAKAVNPYCHCYCFLNVATNSLLPKAAKTLKHQTQDQLDDHLTSLKGQDPSQCYGPNELVKVTGSLSHTLMQQACQQELTRTQRRIKQLELEAQERRKGSDEVEQGKEKITRLQETLATTAHERKQGKAVYADLSDSLQYEDHLLEKAKADSRDKNDSIRALKTHLDKARNEFSRFMRQLDHIKEESVSVKEELQAAC